MTDRPLFYLLDEQGNPVPAKDEDHAQVDALLGNFDARRVGLTKKVIAGRHVMVSTIFLCSDEQYLLTLSEDVPIELFQTCVFVNKITTGLEKYYKTREEAIQGHEDVCRDVDFLGHDVERGRGKLGWLGRNLEKLQGLREIV